MRRVLILTVAFVLTLGVAMFAGTNIISALQRQSYTVTYSMQAGGMTRSYEEIAPVAALPKSAPVIVVLSGIAASTDDEVTRDRLVPYVDAGLAELVYPAGYEQSWNAGGCCGGAAAAKVDDVAFLKALAAQVDPGHAHPIYVVGYSNGGRLAYRMACSAPGVFDATAVVKATTSCLTSDSICAIRSRSTSALRRIASAAFFGTMPAEARVSLAAISTRSQVRNLFSSLQIRPISGRV